MPDLKRFLLGRRLASGETQHTKVNNVIGLSVFSSDALSSTAYATQEIMASLSTAMGHGGAAVVVGAEPGMAEVLATHSVAEELMGTWRTSDQAFPRAGAPCRRCWPARAPSPCRRWRSAPGA